MEQPCPLPSARPMRKISKLIREEAICLQPDVCEILHVDKANRTLYLNVNGCMVTAICAEQRDDELCRQMKSILLKSLSSATVCVEKFDKNDDI